MKRYIKPEIKVVELGLDAIILNGSDVIKKGQRSSSRFNTGNGDSLDDIIDWGN